MSTLVVGDVHGCADELDRLMRLAGADRIVLVGDLFTKGPDPAGVWSLVQEHAMRSTLGNHDDRLLRALEADPGVDREAERCIHALDAVDGGWSSWLAACPLFIEVEGWTVVHAGVNPKKGLHASGRTTLLNVRRWPRDDPDARFWWQQYQGKRRIVFGHDARSGLIRVQRKRAPWLVGLDTGCVYGGSLSGYLLADDRIVQVPAKRQYRKV